MSVPLVGWLVVVYLSLSVPPTVKNEVVLFDQFERSKDILLVVLPIVTTALGYWFGSQGKEQAEQVAEQAATKAADKVAEKKTNDTGVTDPEGVHGATDPEGAHDETGTRRSE